MPTKPFPIATKAGVKRDGTEFDGSFFSDAVWCRFQNGRPKKIGGYKQVTNLLSGPVRAMHVMSRDGSVLVHTGSQSGIETLALTQFGAGNTPTSRTPVGYVANPAMSWQFDDMWDAGGSGTPRIIAHAAPNLLSIDSNAPGAIYIGDITQSSALTLAASAPTYSGGLCVTGPFLFTFGSNGAIAWSDVNLPQTWTGGSAGAANVTGTKIVAGKPVRGGSNGPSAVVWSLDSVIRISFVGSPAIFRFDTITDQSSILSSSGIMEYDGVFFWPGVDRFLMYNGIVREVPNQLNLNWFFDNLNYQYRQKVWAVKVPRYGEIWWFYPRGTATECTDAVIYNLRENEWYDATIDRTAGYFSQVFRYPLMADNSPGSNGKYGLWQHEFGVDKVVGNKALAIPAAIETSDISFVAEGPMQSGWMGQDVRVFLDRIEPDLLQTGPMQVIVKGRSFARSLPVQTTYDFDPTTQYIDVREQHRELRLRFESNVQGGFFEFGQMILHLTTGDGRP